jgi:hypothetical protein
MEKRQHGRSRRGRRNVSYKPLRHGAGGSLLQSQSRRSRCCNRLDTPGDSRLGYPIVFALVIKK